MIECCFKRTVERIMERDKKDTKYCKYFLEERRFSLDIATQEVMVLNTWMLGKTLVDVSIEYSPFTIVTNRLSRSKSLGLKKWPLGKSAETIKNIVIPAYKTLIK